MPLPRCWRTTGRPGNPRESGGARASVDTADPADRPAEELEKVSVTTRLDRPAQPEEISPAGVFLTAPCCSSYITGIVQPITGNAGDGA